MGLSSPYPGKLALYLSLEVILVSQGEKSQPQSLWELDLPQGAGVPRTPKSVVCFHGKNSREASTSPGYLEPFT